MKKGPSKIIQILENCRDFLKVGKFNRNLYREYVEKQFGNINFGNYSTSAYRIRIVLLDSAISRKRALHDVNLFLDILRPFVK